MATQVIVYDQAADMEGKFLQLTLRGQPYLLFAPASAHRYHNQLLARFLSERHVPHDWAAPEQLVIKSNEVIVHGGGRFRVDSKARRLMLWDNSQAYGRFDARMITQQLAGSGHPWGGFDVRIE